MLGGADNPNGELPSYITGADTDGWFEWKQQNGVKQPFFIYRKDGNPLLLAATI